MIKQCPYCFRFQMTDGTWEDCTAFEMAVMLLKEAPIVKEKCPTCEEEIRQAAAVADTDGLG